MKSSVPRLSALLVLLAMTASLGAQELDVTSAVRSVTAGAYGYDYDYDDGEGQTFSALTTAGEWIALASVDLDDWYGIPVGTASAYQESQIDLQALSFTIDVTATTAGNHFHEDSFGEGGYHVAFTLARDARYRIQAHAEVTYGYNMASIVLDDDPGAFGTVFGLYVGQFGSDDATQTGWLAAGTYTLDVEAQVVAYSGSGGPPDAQAGNAEGELWLWHAGDFDLDGDVDLLDRSAYLGAWRGAAPAADYDGDGLVTAADRSGFLAAWRRGLPALRRSGPPQPAGS